MNFLPVSPRTLLPAAILSLIPAVSGAQQSTTIGGYGEVHYLNATGRDTPGEVNVKRMVLYLAHSFSDRIMFRSEVEIEDARIEGGEAGGEVALEQAYLDYRFADAFTLRTGLILVPVGIINETHEPPTFNGVQRPAFDHDLLPTTWREIGVGAVGRLGQGGVNYKVYLMNGLTAESFSADEGIRGGRQEGQEATFANPSLTGRLEWVRPGLRLGGSFWYGGSAAQDPVLGDGTFDVPVTVLSADARFDRGPFAARAVVARVTVGDADRVNAAFGNDVGRRMLGGYVEGSYNMLATLLPATDQRLDAFVRHERFDTQQDVPAGTSADGANDRRITTAGLTWRPVYNVAFKADYQWRRNAAGTGEDEVLGLGMGFSF